MNIGEIAPTLTLKDSSGGDFDLSSLIGKKWTVLFFYPADNTPVCTKEACAFRDSYDIFTSAGAEVVGISSDTVATHGEFVRKHSLRFPVLSDPDGAARKAFGVPSSMLILPGRVTYVIDPAGIVRLVFSAQLQAERHVEEALSIIRAEVK